jgi:hypothetical protein
MTPEQMARATEFAGALGKLKAKQDLGQGAELTAAEVDGIIWGIRQLRGGAKHGPADNAAKR